MQGNYFSNGMSNMYGQNSLVRPNNVNFNPYLANDSYRNYGSSPYNFSSNYGNTPLSYSRLPNLVSDHEEYKMDPVFNQYNTIQQEQINSPYHNKPSKPKLNSLGTKKSSNMGLSNRPVFNACILNQSQTPKPKSTTEKNKSSSSTFTLASNNILSGGNGYHSHSYGNIENISSNTHHNKNSNSSTTSTHQEINSNNYHPLILNNQMTSNRNNYLSSHSDSENIRVVNPVLSSSSDQNRIIGNINTTRRRDHSENQVNLNRITSNSNTTRNQTSNRNYNQGQFNSNLDYIGTVIAQSLQELQEDAIFDEIEERSNRNQLNRANSNSNNYTTTTMSNNFNTNTLSGNMIQPIRYAPAYEYLPRLHSLSEVIPINSQTGRFYLGRDRNMNILRGRIVLGDDGGITISLSDMVGGGESVQTFPNPNALAEMGGLDAIVSRVLGDNLEHIEWVADFFASLFSHFTEGQQQQIIEKNKSKGLTEEDIEKIPIVEFKKASKKKKKDESNDSLCYICLMDYEDKDCLRELPCKHKFHKECLDPWLKSKNECPTCRAKVNE